MGDILPFDPVARKLAEVPIKDRLDALITADDARDQVHALDAFALYSLIREVGIESALELVNLASGEQSQAFLDFECWTKGALDHKRLAHWLSLLFQGDDEKIVDLSHELDAEVLGRFLREHVHVLFWRSEEDEALIQVIDAPIQSSPDGVYALVMPEDPDVAALIRLIIHRLYQADQDAARQFLHAARWELNAPLEETAYQVRKGRIEQYGFLPTEEATAVFAPVDPSGEKEAADRDLNAEEPDVLAFSTRTAVQLPVPIIDELRQVTRENPTFLGEALDSATQTVTDGLTADALFSQISTLVNITVSANLESPSDGEALKDSFRRVHDYLNVGLRYLANSEVETAGRLLNLWPLKRVLRVGHSLSISLARQAKILLQRENLTLVEGLSSSLCGADVTDLLAGLTEMRPMRSKMYQQGFRTLEQIEHAAKQLTLVAYKELWTYNLRHHRKDELVALLLGPPGAVPNIDQISFDSLLATETVVLLLDGVQNFRLVKPSEIGRILSDEIGAEGLSEALAAALDKASTAGSANASPATAHLARTWASTVKQRLIDEYGVLQGGPATEAQFLAPLILLENDTGGD